MDQYELIRTAPEFTEKVFDRSGGIRGITGRPSARPCLERNRSIDGENE
jgi:hypothetical protein